MRILITGGSGFIGQHAAKHLLAAGHDVTTLDIAENGIDGVRHVKGSICDAETVGIAMEGQDAVVHLAAVVSAAGSIDDPETTYTVNIEASVNVLAAARLAGVKKAVLASSAAVYGLEPSTPTKEDEPLQPLSPYAESKIAMEELATEAGLPTVCLRFFNVYGPSQKADSQYAAAIPAFVTKALANEPLTIYGDGEQTRDFVYVADIAKAIELALTKGTGVMNIASGKKTSINELAKTIIKLTESESDIEHAEPRDGDPRISAADVSTAKKELDFSATTELEEGLKETISWYQSND
ncbi:NAD-dependent epimerase/dehydratase family protein [Candidatus Woesearchaeota archaeon]|nr:NAD-dependent epimerase/dehydratase family protein [Candidatus Woesearchaeota archaeon]